MEQMEQMEKTALAIMAAGIGSRYGGGIKQLEAVGPSGEIIMDYSIHDALEAGFNKLVFIIRREIESDFREVIGDRIEAICRPRGVGIEYAFQSLEDVPEGIAVPAGRTKPWGTGQAILACRGLIKEPFAVINADDYYGKQAFTSLFRFLQDYTPERPNEFCMAGFVLKNTLSENGGVTRGVCRLDRTGCLANVIETHNIIRDRGTEMGTGYTESLLGERETVSVPLDSLVSMNMWGLTPQFIQMLYEEFPLFFRESTGNEQKAEFLVPVFIGKLLERKAASVKVLKTEDTWFGITYKQDTPAVKEAFARLVEAGVYSRDLFSDL